MIKRFFALVLLAVSCSVSWAQVTTYTYPATNYLSVADFTAPCAIPSCRNFTTTMAVTGLLTTLNRLPINQVSTDIRTQISSFSFSDGITTYSSTDPAVRLIAASVATDPAGAINGYTITIQRWQDGLAGPHALGSRFDDLFLAGGTITSPQHNIGCTIVSNLNGVADSCAGTAAVDPSKSFANLANPALLLPSNFTIGGNLSGLTSGSVVLQNNNGDDLTLNKNGAFTFPTAINNGNGYNVRVLTQPAGQICSVTPGTGSGTVNGGPVSNVAVSCMAAAPATFTVSGQVFGLTTGTLVLQNNGGNNITKNPNISGAFTFPAQADLSPYNVTVLPPQPAGLNCTVTNGTGNIAGANVNNVVVNCTPTPVTFTIGGNLTGLTSGSVVLQNNNGDNLTLNKNGAFTFNTALPDNTQYNVRVSTQPANQNCSVTPGTGSGTVNGGPVSNVAVNCVAAAVVPPPATIANVPTISEWGLILLGGILALVGMGTVRRRNPLAPESREIT